MPGEDGNVQPAPVAFQKRQNDHGGHLVDQIFPGRTSWAAVRQGHPIGGDDFRQFRKVILIFAVISRLVQIDHVARLVIETIDVAAVDHCRIVITQQAGQIR